MKRTIILFGMAAIVLMIGCGKRIVTVTGEVQYNGVPAKDIAVLFEPKSTAEQIAESGVAVTDAEGRFKLESSSAKSGIEPGSYAVYLGWQNPVTVEDGGAGPSPESEANQVEVPYQFPPERQELVVEVQGDGENHFVFDITPENIVRK